MDTAGERMVGICSARCDDAPAAPPEDDEDLQSASTALPFRARGGRSKNKQSLSKALEDKLDKALEDKLDQTFSAFGSKLDKVEEHLRAVPDNFVDMISQRDQQINTFREQRDRARLRTIVARGKLAEIRRRIQSHTDARCLELLDDVSSEPSSVESDETDDDHDSLENDEFDEQYAPDCCEDPPVREDGGDGALGFPYLTRSDESRVKAASRNHAKLVVQTRLFRSIQNV